ncbi:hypothetical protein M758_11G091600 [Ceratodon purpureus]|uniref:Uncharacterized protein n=1 Tax=Ceratodon purpureus TaxID=3225 RepID=A0A8T0GD88_CERPU|nr:hypothetical protein KC19_11G094500 [Ceratodon purpureus]KAG0601196.1 hypothetical protein M758_11G091600 [Ceratodon purpureus]
MADKASSSKGPSENPHVPRRPSKYPNKYGPKKPFVDPKMKEVITANLKVVLGKLTNVTDLIVKRNKEIGGENAKQPKIIEALNEANVALKKLEDKKFPEEALKKKKP